MFADVKGSMKLAEQLDPEEWHAILDRFFQILTDGVHRFEGTVNQYTGDGIMALFGAPIAHEDHAQRACYAALHLRDEIARYATEVKREHGVGFSARMGINSGEKEKGDKHLSAPRTRCRGGISKGAYPLLARTGLRSTYRHTVRRCSSLSTGKALYVPWYRWPVPTVR